MILVTGATGFIGRVLVRQLSETGRQVRVLLRPSPQSPRLPKGVPVEVAVVSLNDERGLTIIMVTHEPEMAAFAHRTIHFLDGRIDDFSREAA